MSKDITKGGTSTQGRQGSQDRRNNQSSSQSGNQQRTSTSPGRQATTGGSSRDHETAREIWPGQPRVDLPGTQAGRSQNEQERRQRERNQPQE